MDDNLSYPFYRMRNKHFYQTRRPMFYETSIFKTKNVHSTKILSYHDGEKTIVMYYKIKIF
jgi:hypothetical protein